MSKKKDQDFVTIRIKRSDHERLTRFVTHDIKIHDLITNAVDRMIKEVKK